MKRSLALEDETVLHRTIASKVKRGYAIVVQTSNGESVHGYPAALDREWLSIFTVDSKKFVWVSLAHVVRIDESSLNISQLRPDERDTVRGHQTGLRRAANQYLVEYEGGPNGTL